MILSYRRHILLTIVSQGTATDTLHLPLGDAAICSCFVNPQHAILIFKVPGDCRGPISYHTSTSGASAINERMQQVELPKDLIARLVIL